MDCDGLVDEDQGPRDFLIDLWPYARPARFSSSMTSLSAMFFVFRFYFISLDHSESHPARVFSGIPLRPWPSGLETSNGQVSTKAFWKMSCRWQASNSWQF